VRVSHVREAGSTRKTPDSYTLAVLANDSV